jgi:simple sugar transport system ATP-binding protein
MVHQHFTLAANLTVLENVMAGSEWLTRLASDTKTARAKLAALSSRFGLTIRPDARVGDLSVGERQRVEILKALYRDVRILILDEPTAVLTKQEATQLYATLRIMAGEGLSLIFISHKLQEVLDAADRVVVLRAGRLVAECRSDATDRNELAELMVGRKVTRPQRDQLTADGTASGDILLQANALSGGPAGQQLLEAANFAVRDGEILGIIGVAGNGQVALAHLVFGLSAPSAGALHLFGRQMISASPRSWVAAGVGRVPEDRHAGGAIGEMTLWENAILERVREPRFSRFGWVRRAAARRFTADIVARFDVRGGTADSRLRLLSGGNMQKFILGRSLDLSATQTGPRLLVVAQPTRGLDEGAVAFVHAQLLQARREGAGILLISEDLDEILALADRAQAMMRGRLSPPVPIAQADAQRLGLMMAGLWENAA